MLVLIIAFLVAAAATLVIVLSSKIHSRHSGDKDFSKPQKFHAVAVPRIGGLGIVLGILAGTAVLSSTMGIEVEGFGFALLLLVCSQPAFLAGFIQDFTEALTPRGRLAATALSAALAYYAMDAAIIHTAIPGLDWLVTFAAGSLAITVFAVSGIANAVNIIDGFNGLASMCVVLMLAALAYVAFQCNDPLIGYIALAGIGAVLGFFVWNFPGGLIFLGDGGAYFLGFFVAELSILLLHRNPGEVSPICPLLVCIYPICETLFSIYRRRWLRALPPSLPDGIHLHSLIYRRMLRWAGDSGAKAHTRRNSLTSPYLWLLCAASVVPAMLFWNSTPVLLFFLLAFAVTYVVLYWRIVRFKSPRWMVFRWTQTRSRAKADN